MDWPQLLASIIDSLAWPVAVGVIAYVLRKPLVGLLSNLRRLKYKDLDLEFGKKLDRLEHELGGIEQRVPPKAAAPPSDIQLASDEAFDRLAEIAPGAAVLETWMDIEKKLRLLAARHDITDRRRRSALYVTRMLGSREVISPRLASLLDDLRDLRNVAVHQTVDRQISFAEARRYREIAEQVGNELQLLLEE